MFQWVVGGLCVCFGIMLKACWDAVKDLQTADKTLVERVTGVEVLVAGKYVTHDDMDKLSTAIFAKLDRIEDKLDHKVDKP